MLSRGETNQAIAQSQGISLKLTERHIQIIFLKLNVSDRITAALKAIQERIT